LLDYVAIYRIQRLMDMIHRCGSTKSSKQYSSSSSYSG
jgi:hypothetical protein